MNDDQRTDMPIRIWKTKKNKKIWVNEKKIDAQKRRATVIVAAETVGSQSRKARPLSLGSNLCPQMERVARPGCL